ncbi:hypothetical protein SS50377_26503 [Spironucleus salmonicida]|uniref:Uncharacterized protein n=1 Tax=Spironucleus salmonicida TaxID=348837 RepID=V6LAV6_9EUKA|nr:hypothetical protein SS50377_26503 [Spironucleus salmonicida]|eukprot:EST41358.1 Hypothetical protein SS50377_19072 [Spironucleus salmonicida]
MPLTDIQTLPILLEVKSQVFSQQQQLLQLQSDYKEEQELNKLMGQMIFKTISKDKFLKKLSKREEVTIQEQGHQNQYIHTLTEQHLVGLVDSLQQRLQKCQNSLISATNSSADYRKSYQKYKDQALGLQSKTESQKLQLNRMKALQAQQLSMITQKFDDQSSDHLVVLAQNIILEEDLNRKNETIKSYQDTLGKIEIIQQQKINKAIEIVRHKTTGEFQNQMVELQDQTVYVISQMRQQQLQIMRKEDINVELRLRILDFYMRNQGTKERLMQEVLADIQPTLSQLKDEKALLQNDAEKHALQQARLEDRIYLLDRVKIGLVEQNSNLKKERTFLEQQADEQNRLYNNTFRTLELVQRKLIVTHEQYLTMKQRCAVLQIDHEKTKGHYEYAVQYYMAMIQAYQTKLIGAKMSVKGIRIQDLIDEANSIQRNPYTIIDSDTGLRLQSELQQIQLSDNKQMILAQSSFAEQLKALQNKYSSQQASPISNFQVIHNNISGQIGIQDTSLVLSHHDICLSNDETLERQILYQEATVIPSQTCGIQVDAIEIALLVAAVSGKHPVQYFPDYILKKASILENPDFYRQIYDDSDFSKLPQLENLSQLIKSLSQQKMFPSEGEKLILPRKSPLKSRSGSRNGSRLSNRRIYKNQQIEKSTDALSFQDIDEKEDSGCSTIDMQRIKSPTPLSQLPPIEQIEVVNLELQSEQFKQNPIYSEQRQKLLKFVQGQSNQIKLCPNDLQEVDNNGVDKDLFLSKLTQQITNNYQNSFTQTEILTYQDQSSFVNFNPPKQLLDFTQQAECVNIEQVYLDHTNELTKIKEENQNQIKNISEQYLDQQVVCNQTLLENWDMKRKFTTLQENYNNYYTQAQMLKFDLRQTLNKFYTIRQKYDLLLEKQKSHNCPSIIDFQDLIDLKIEEGRQQLYQQVLQEVRDRYKGYAKLYSSVLVVSHELHQTLREMKDTPVLFKVVHLQNCVKVLEEQVNQSLHIARQRNEQVQTMLQILKQYSVGERGMVNSKIMGKDLVNSILELYKDDETIIQNSYLYRTYKKLENTCPRSSFNLLQQEQQMEDLDINQLTVQDDQHQTLIESCDTGVQVCQVNTDTHYSLIKSDISIQNQLNEIQKLKATVLSQQKQLTLTTVKEENLQKQELTLKRQLELQEEFFNETPRDVDQQKINILERQIITLQNDLDAIKIYYEQRLADKGNEAKAIEFMFGQNSVGLVRKSRNFDGCMFKVSSMKNENNLNYQQRSKTARRIK